MKSGISIKVRLSDARDENSSMPTPDYSPKEFNHVDKRKNSDYPSPFPPTFDASSPLRKGK